MGKLLLVACTNVGRYIIETFMNDPDIGAELVGVINLNAEQAVNKANYDAYSDLVIKYNLPIFYCDSINDPETVAFIKERQPDVILQSGWSQKFSDEVLALPKYGCIGEHPAPLPRGRGAACVNWAILTGETQWGDSYFKMVSKYDEGHLYAQKFFTIETYDTVYTIYEKVAMCAMEVVSQYASKWTNGIFDIVEQNESLATYYHKRRPADGEILTFDQDSAVMHNFIRAQTHPYPGAYITAKATRKKLYLLQSDICPDCKTSATPGTILGTTEKGGLKVAAGNGQVLILQRVKWEGFPSIWAANLIESQTQHPSNIFDL